MKACMILFVIIACGLARNAEAKIVFSGEKKQNNLVSVLLEASWISKSSKPMAAGA